MNKCLEQGKTWIFEIAIVDNDGDECDCIGYDCKIYIKKGLSDTAPQIQALDIFWTEQCNGYGLFKLTHDMSKIMSGIYWYEIILYYIGTYEVVDTLIQARLNIKKSLKVFS